MKKLSRFKWVLTIVGFGALSVGALVGVSWLTLSVAHAESKPAIDSQTKIRAESTLTAKERAEVSRAAGHMLKHIYRARVAVAKKDKAAALNHVKQAIQLSRIIKRVMPKYDVRTKFEAKGMTYTDNEKVQPLLVPLFNELDRVDFLEPFRAAKRVTGHRARKAKATSVVSESDLDYVSLTMDVKWATTKLWNAKYYLDKAKWDRADDSLRQGQQSVSFEADVETMPLAKAADNIALARDLIKANHPSYAAEALKAASSTLQVYRRGASKSRKKEVSKLQKEIKTLRKKIAGAKKLSSNDKAAAAAKTQYLWNYLLPWRSKNICSAAPSQPQAQQCVATR